MKAPYKLFTTSTPRNVEVVTYTDGNIDRPAKSQWSKTLWVERDEDWYALESPQYNHGTVRIVTREDYMRSAEMEDGSGVACGECLGLGCPSCGY